jgi:hypothetical protein
MYTSLSRANNPDPHRNSEDNMKRYTCVWSSVLLTCTWLPSAQPANPETVNGRQLVKAYGKLPLRFEANQGQTDQRVSFLARGSGYALFLTGDEAVLSLERPVQKRGRKSLAATDAALRIRLVGTNATAKPTGLNELQGRSNYFIANDPKEWRTSVPNYARVQYRNVYPGVDLVYYGNQQHLEYDFILAPRADPKMIDLDLQGADQLEINAQGDLIVHMHGGEIRFQPPQLYQEVYERKQAVSGRYVLRGKGRVGFDTGRYDPTKPLIIDPVLAYSTYLGGFTQGLAIAVDRSGSAYVTGIAGSTDFPTTPGAFQTKLAGSGPSAWGDVFVTKFSADGSALVYSTYLGGSNDDRARSIALDSSGNAYVTGQTNSIDFPTVAPFQSSCVHHGTGTCGSAFVSKLNADGSKLLYSTYLGGNGASASAGIAVDSGGNAYVAGSTTAADFPTTPGAFQQQCISCAATGTFNAFITKFNAQGTALIYSTFLDGSNKSDYSDAGGIALDASGNAYVAGSTSSTDFPTTPGAFQTTYAGGQGDGYVTKLNASGSALLYSTYLGGSLGDSPVSIAVDSSGNSYVTGATFSTDFPTTPGAVETSFDFNNLGVDFLVDTFVTKLNPSGTGLVYSTFLGVGQGAAIAVDAAGRAYIAGAAGSIPVVNPIQADNAGGEDAFVSELNAAGSALTFSTYLGGSNNDWAAGIALAGDDIYITGAASQGGFPITAGAFQTSFVGQQDAIVCKLSFGIPFSSFKAKLALDVDDGAFDLSAKFTPGPNGSINPATEPVALIIGPYSVTIPAGSFKRRGESYFFKGVIDGVHLRVYIHHNYDEHYDDNDLDQLQDHDSHGREGKKARYSLRAEGRGANLSGIANPVAVTITIGSNGDSTKVIADFD